MLPRMKQVRVRYAPSPTGEPHLGNIRTAMFSWLFARHNNGEFIIRIEDTDQSRVVEGALESQLEVLKWLGIDWDEGPDVGGKFAPYIQSQRIKSYQSIATRLIEDGAAYQCYCSPERLEKLRKEPREVPYQKGYDGYCRGLTDEQRRAKEKESGAAAVVRFAMPREGETKVDDRVRGQVVFQNNLVEDFILLKSDGFPTYHLASVVDDHAMEISHVLRAEEWLSSTPRHLHLYRELGWTPPEFAHLPVILAPDKSKLSKRHGATSVLEYREIGYLPEAMVNFLALIGWALDDKTQVLSKQQLIENFSLDRVNKSGAIFDVEKLNWMNGYYLRNMSADSLTDILLEYWHLYPPEELVKIPNREQVLMIMPLVRERLKMLRDAVPLIGFFFKDTVEYNEQELIQNGMNIRDTEMVLKRSMTALKTLSKFSADSIELVLRSLASDLGLSPRQLLGVIRVAMTGQKIAPPLFETIEILGRERSLNSLREALTRVKNYG